VLAFVGALLVPSALLAVGTVKVMSLRRPLAAQVDSWSSSEMTDLGHRSNGRTRRLLQVAFAGGVPAIASAGVCLGILTTSIGNEVSSGPNRPIAAVLDRIAPGNEMIVGYAAAMPMVESDVTVGLADRVVADAAKIGVRAHLLRIDLGSLQVHDRTLAALTLGIGVPVGSPLAWDATSGCRSIPAEVDADAGAPTGSKITLDGQPVDVVATTSGISAINRIGVVMDQQAVASCLQKDPTAPLHAVVLAATANTTRELLAQADSSGQTAAVISATTYLANSEAFWTSNVKPITNILAVVSGLVALVAMAGSMSGRLLRNRREYASKLAAGASVTVLAGTELLRATKDGLVACLVGTALAFVVIPLTSATEPGLQAGISRSDVLVGCAIGLVGCVGGAAFRAARIDKAVNVAESTRI
jgi:hypothetical protein